MYIAYERRLNELEELERSWKTSYYDGKFLYLGEYSNYRELN